MQRIKGKSSRKLLQQFSHLNKECWGQHLWSRGFFVASSGVVRDEAIIESSVCPNQYHEPAAGARRPGDSAGVTF
jgi:REP element-mobilizing transposase RayT